MLLRPRLDDLFQSTPPARGATLLFRPLAVLMGISIHAPREGGDCMVLGYAIEIGRFQSTPPARGATIMFNKLASLTRNFNPRPPRGGRRLYCGGHPVRPVISIHAPREGGDAERRDPGLHQYISIHAPREGGDV